MFQLSTRVWRLRQLFANRFRFWALAVCWLAIVSAQPARASSFGFSVNINFGAEEPVNGPAGRFGDRVWNSTRESSGRAPIITDVYGDTVQTPATILWESPGLATAEGIQRRTPRNDAAIMRNYLESPSRIELRNLDQVIPRGERDELVYSLILYTYGGQEGKEGEYQVNQSRPRRHLDPGTFDGTYRAGVRGNMVIFPNLRNPDLFINAEGFGPVNAISMVYCLPGDFDGDGQVNGADLEKLSGAIKGGETDPAFDVNFDGAVDNNDVMSWIKCSKGTCIGDVNLDGAFNSSDLVQLFQGGIYETDGEATWTSGDWNGDCKFDSSDLLLAFQEGCYESSGELARYIPANSPGSAPWIGTPESDTFSVPEPSGMFPWAVAIGLLACRRQVESGRAYKQETQAGE